MLKNYTVFFAFCIASIFTAAVAAQNTTLGNAVAAADNSTPLQVVTGNSVQNTCVELIPKYSVPEAPTDNPAEAAFFTHCSEMVGTAFALIDPRNPNPLGWNNEQLAEGQQQMTGEEQVSKGSLATENSNGQFGNIGMRLDAIRAGARATAGGLSVAMEGAPVVGGNAGEDTGDGIGWGWFLNGAIGTGDRDATAREDRYDYDAYGATLGFDYQFESGIVAGFALGYTDYEVKFGKTKSFVPGQQLVNTQAGGGFDSDGYSISGYAIGDIGRFYIDGIVSVGQSDYSSDRIVKYTSSDQSIIVDRSMRGDTDSDTLVLGLSTGTTFALGSVDLAVSLGLNYLDVSVDGYTEKDHNRGLDTAEFSGLALAYDDQDFDSLQSIFGFQLSRVFSTSMGVLVPYINADWRHEFENESRTETARYAAQGTGETFPLTIATDDPDEDYFEFGIGISAVFANNIQAFVDYRTTVDLENVSAELFTIGIRGAF